VNLKYKCKGCGREHDITVQPYDEKDAWTEGGKEWQRIAAFECRGMDPYEYEIRDGYQVEAADGSKFEDVDLSDDWMDVDGKGNPVSISNVKARLEGAKAEKKKK